MTEAIRPAVEIARVHYKDPTTEPLENLFAIAVRMFSRASGRYPNSFPAQGASIALQCRNERWHPAALKSAVIRQQGDLCEIVDKANVIHERHGIKKVTAVEVLETMKTDLAWAEMMMILVPSELEEVLKGYRPVTDETKTVRSAHEEKYAKKTRQKIESIQRFGRPTKRVTLNIS